jgi:hypothetical protein
MLFLKAACMLLKPVSRMLTCLHLAPHADMPAPCSSMLTCLHLAQDYCLPYQRGLGFRVRIHPEGQGREADAAPDLLGRVCGRNRSLLLTLTC